MCIVIQCQRVALRIADIPGGQGIQCLAYPLAGWIISISNRSSCAYQTLYFVVYSPVDTAYRIRCIRGHVADRIIGIVVRGLVIHSVRPVMGRYRIGYIIQPVIDQPAAAGVIPVRQVIHGCCCACVAHRSGYCHCRHK